MRRYKFGNVKAEEGGNVKTTGGGVMKNSTYKKILGKIPAGVFVFGEDLRILYANASFARAFASPGYAKKAGESIKSGAFLDAYLSCPVRAGGGEKKQSFCGKKAECGYCTLHRVMARAARENAEQSDVISVTVNKGNRTETIGTRIRILPVDDESSRGKKRGKRLFLGLTDGAMQTEIAREMLTAKRMQQRLLPAGKQTGGVPYSYMYIPCLDIGGDLPDVYELDGKVYGVLSDVSGKGISAGMLSAFIRAGFNRKEQSVAKAVSSLRDKFVELNPDERSYITVAAVCMDKATHTLSYVLAGHNAPILLKSGRGYGINEIEDPAPPVSNWIADYRYAEKTMPYEAGDLLVLLSDGVTECANTAGERFGIERAESVLMQSACAEDFIGKLKNALTVFCGGKFGDDITAMAFDLK